MTLLDARKLAKSYRRGTETVHALRDASFQLRPGELVALVGPSGSGKTTLLNLVAGWERPDGGEITWDGHRAAPVRLAGLGWAELAVVPQAMGIFDELSVAENVDLPARLGGDGDGLAPLLEQLGLTGMADRLPDEISLGERQRVAIGRALRRSPRLLLADEPTDHQDAVWADEVVAVLRRACAERGMACLVATHDADVLEQVDRALRLYDGDLTDV